MTLVGFQKCHINTVCLNILQFFLQRLLKEMEGLLGCWKSFLLPLASDPELAQQTQHLCKTLSNREVTVSEEMLKVCVIFFIPLVLDHQHPTKSKWDRNCKTTTTSPLAFVSGCSVSISFALPRRPP